MLNRQTSRTNESPIFYALKLPNSEVKSEITKTLLKQKTLFDFKLKNSLGHNCIEAHADFTSYDESASLVEKAMMTSQDNQNKNISSSAIPINE